MRATTPQDFENCGPLRRAWVSGTAGHQRRPESRPPCTRLHREHAHRRENTHRFVNFIEAAYIATVNRHSRPDSTARPKRWVAVVLLRQTPRTPPCRGGIRGEHMDLTGNCVPASTTPGSPAGRPYCGWDSARRSCSGPDPAASPPGTRPGFSELLGVSGDQVTGRSVPRCCWPADS